MFPFQFLSGRGGQARMRLHPSLIAAPVLVVLSMGLLTGAAHAGNIPDGGKCSDTEPMDIKAANAQCGSKSSCSPGPQTGGVKAAWYCSANTVNCSFPNSKIGAMDWKGRSDYRVCINHVAYACMNTGVGQMHFAPTGQGKGFEACNLPPRVVHKQATCAVTGDACSSVGKFCTTDGNGNVCQSNDQPVSYPQLKTSIP